MGQIDVEKLWKAVNATLVEGAINRPLWEASRTAVALAHDEEDECIVLGMPTNRMELRGHIETRVNKARLMEIVQAKLGRRLDIRVIEGETKEAYERDRERQQLRIESREQAHLRAQGVATAAESWDALNEQVLLAHTQSEGRRFVHNRAKFLIRCVRMLVEAEDRIRDREPGKEEFHERQLARTIEKIATMTEGTPITVSLEYMRYKATKKRRG
ncbi:MAG TPA: hypothetical protein QGH10_16925 [Armatimonadota bacterium]|nr:hypothetical protein [Armatimonadota bacterium]